MKKLFVTLLSALGMICLLMGGYLLYLYTHREIKPTDYYHHLSSECVLDIDQESKSAAEKILAGKKFTYLGNGVQMVAFESEDHQYVIKYFLPRRNLKKKWFVDPKKLLHFSSLRWISHVYLKRKARLEKLLKRHQLAFEKMREEAGLVYVHINDSTSLSGEVQLVDKEGETVFLPLNKYPFVLQKKAVLIPEALNGLIASGDLQGAQNVLLGLKNLFTARAEKGITDRQQTMHNNYGFINGKAIQIDLGRIAVNQTIAQNSDEELARIFKMLKQWTDENYPQLTFSWQ